MNSRRVTLVILIIGTIAIGIFAHPVSGLVLIPAVLVGAWAHEYTHYLPLKPWGEDLYIEVWPFIELRPGEPSDAFGHVGGTFNPDIPLRVLQFSMVAPVVVFGWIPLAFAAMYGLPDITQLVPFVREIVESPSHFAVLVFLVAVIPLSPGDIYHLQNAPRIKEAGSLDMKVWEYAEQ